MKFAQSTTSFKLMIKDDLAILALSRKIYNMATLCIKEYIKGGVIKVRYLLLTSNVTEQNIILGSSNVKTNHNLFFLSFDIPASMK